MLANNMQKIKVAALPDISHSHMYQDGKTCPPGKSELVFRYKLNLKNSTISTEPSKFKNMFKHSIKEHTKN